MSDPAPLDVADRAIALSSDTMAHDFLAALLAELRQMPDHWLRLNEQKQQQIIERLKEKIRAGTEKAVAMFLHGEFPAVSAELKGVAFGGSISATLSVARDALHRHALSDAQGKRVLVIIADAGRWTARMDEIKARADQLDLWDAEYDPAKDQPAYRRDQDRTLTGPTWADLKKSLGVGDKPADAAPSTEGEKSEAAPGDTPSTEAAKTDSPPETPTGDAPIVDSDLPEDRIRAAEIYGLREKLAAIGIGISFGALRVHTDEELKAAGAWAEAYAADPTAVPIERPEWLPPADQGAQR